MFLTEVMLSGLTREVTGGTVAEYGGEAIDLAPPWPRRTMVELVAEQAGVPAERLLERDAAAALAARHALAVRPEMTAGHLLGALFEALVEPGLVQPTFVTQFPVELSPLARRNDRDPRFVDRFELIVARQEIANAFSELNDPEDLRARRRVFLSLISAISLLGVTIGVATLNIVLAVMTGFEQDLRDKILGFNPHIVVVSYSGPIEGKPGLVERVRAVDGVVAAAPFIYGQAMLTVGRNVSGVVVRGIDPGAAGAVVDVEHHIEQGSLAGLAVPHRVTLPPEEGGGTVELSGLLLGRELARQLGVAPGDVVTVVSPLGTRGPTGMVPRVKRFVLAGLFDSGLYDYDTTLAYMAVPDAQRFFDLHDGITGIEVRVRDIYAARGVARAIEAALGGFPYRARDWMEVNRNLFSALKLEKVVYGIVLCLIVVVAAFNILASLTMVVKEKRRDIAILKSMGGSNRSIGRIFILNGAVIGVAGTLLGNLLGLGGCWLLAHYRFVELPKDVFLVTTLPVRMDPINFLVVATVSVGICVVAALSPARRAASLVPVEVIRYE